MSKIIYLDNAATTPVRPEVFAVMKKHFSEDFGNPGSITKIGVTAKGAVLAARKTIADILAARPKEIIFTGSGTEANNLAILGVARDLEKKGHKISDLHFIATNIEHSSITECFKEIERLGGKVDYLPVQNSGLINPKDLRKALKDNTALVSIGYANGEIGIIQPIREIAKEVRHAKKNNKLAKQDGPVLNGLPYLHTDASQAAQYLNLNINQLGVDLMTIDAQKIYGPKGVGALFVKDGVEVEPIIFGGGQERGLRSGTENVAGIAGFAKALELVGKNKIKESKRVAILRDYFIKKIKQAIPKAILNGDEIDRLPNNVNISIPGIDAEFTVLCLDEKGIVCSTRSACVRDGDGSQVVRVLGGGEEVARSSLRFSLGIYTTKKDLDFAVKKLTDIVKKFCQ
ncbi:MAG: cysteine desulfurase family protein [bacterium]